MAHRTLIRDNLIDQENADLKKIGQKSVLVQPPKSFVLKRAALGEVGNKLSNLTTNTNDEVKKVGIKKAPVLAARKHTEALKDKEPLKIKATLPQERTTLANLKPIFKRQESVLKKNVDSEKRNVLKPSALKKLMIYDPDENSKNEPQMVTEYLKDIFDYLREMEIKFGIKKNFLEDHSSTPKMRSILVNWLVDVHLNFKFQLETLHICVSIIDRYLQENKKIGRDTLQLVGTSALIIAAKYEEMYLPLLEDFVFICDEVFSMKQILRMEMDILKKLDFNLGRPVSVHFLRRYNKIAQVRSDHHTLGKYILELVLLNYELAHVRPSLLAAATCCLSTAILNEVMDLPKVWTPTLVHYTTYEYANFRSLIVELAHVLVDAESSKYQTIQKKYASSSYAKISLNPKLHGPLVKKLTNTLLRK